MDGQINKMWFVHTVNYHLALKRKKILPYATAHMNLEDIMLSEIKPVAKRQVLYDSIYTRYLA